MGGVAGSAPPLVRTGRGGPCQVAGVWPKRSVKGHEVTEVGRFRTM